MNIIEVTKRGYCIYCTDDSNKHEKFFQIRNDQSDAGTFVISICEKHAKDLRDDLILLFGDEK